MPLPSDREDSHEGRGSLPGPWSRLRVFFMGLVPLFVLAHFSHHVVGALLTPLLPFIRNEFLLNKTQVGFLGSAYNLPYGLGQLPGGWLADRIGARKLILIGISGVALAGLLVGLSPGYALLASFLILLGLAGGGYHPAASPLVSASIGAENRGSALGLHQIGGTASFFLTPLIAAGIAGAIGWRGTFISLSVPAIVFGIALYVLLGRRRHATDTQAAPPTTGETHAAAPPARWWRLVPFVILGVLLQVFIFSSVSFAPIYANERLGASEAAAASLLAVAHLAGLGAGPLGGYLSDRLGKVPMLLAASLLAGPAIYLLNTASMGWSISAVLFLMGVCQYVGMPVSEAYIIQHTPEHRRSTVLGVYYLASRGGPGLVMPALGNLIDRFDYDTGFTVVAIAMAAVTIACAPFLWGQRD